MPDKPPFDPARWAMALLAVLIVTPSIMALVISVRCSIWFIPTCLDRPWVTVFRDWLGETVPVLVAIIMTGRGRSPPPD